MDYRPEPSVIDDTPNRKVNTMLRPLHVREFGQRTSIAPYVPDVFVGDRTPDPRGTENIPDTRRIYNMSLAKSRWIRSNLHTDVGLQQVSEQIPHLRLVENKQTADKIMKGYLKIFSSE
jgi:hypothetical protein